MKTRNLKSSLACAALALLLLPAAAHAVKPGYEVRSKKLALVLDLGVSNGYSVDLLTQGNTVVVGVSKDGAVAFYRSKGTVSLRRVEADFGSFGRISARFSGRTLVGDLSKRCKGRSPAVAVGTYRGTFQFKGEDNYVEVATDRADGLGNQDYRRVCRKRGDRGQSNRTSATRPLPTESNQGATILSVESESPERVISLSAIGLESIARGGKRTAEPGVSVIVGVEEGHENVAIERLAVLEDERGLTFSPPKVRPVSIAVTPSSPFAGTATFLQEPGFPASWTGDLNVTLPGAAPIPLTGLDFKAGFCRLLDDPGKDGCAAGTPSAATPLGNLGRLSSAAPSPRPWATPGSPG
jgi:hypothetical protein